MQHADALCIVTGIPPNSASLPAFPVSDLQSWVEHQHGLGIAVESMRLGDYTDTRFVFFEANDLPSLLVHEPKAPSATWS